MTVYTLGLWTVRPGHEEEFVRAWTDLAEQTKLEFPDEQATLLRDGDQPNLFISFGPWTSIAQIDQWRASDTFKNGVGQIRALIDDFVPHTMHPVAGID
ncbi:quinol monooxygenase YgiN [Kribbella aluminosa]|uniref:Quinol monooxygenase YgiN n=1 Tax=Kribbella aluminosa TaxID=416017 RepID=A0ABS4UMS3_9ACTN|nr:antibiotic biosynthesis monooxygenase family protein [Kribbella aluminosa]MBP2352953.1 quinol monooxygenase YgiN [Kribbella aluminosa]